jgi:hypothetical protein
MWLIYGKSMVNNGYDDGFHDGFNNNLVGGLEHDFYFSIYWEVRNPN